MLKSPLDGVRDLDWDKYVLKSVKPGKTPPGLVGMFRFKLKALEDIGIVENVKKRGGKWSADWKVYSKEVFLRETKLQYAAFKEQSVLHQQWLITRYRPSIGAELEGQLATLSGLLAVMRALGIGCFEKWLEGDRLSYATNTFLEMNRIF